MVYWIWIKCALHAHCTSDAPLTYTPVTNVSFKLALAPKPSRFVNVVETNKESFKSFKQSYFLRRPKLYKNPDLKSSLATPVVELTIFRKQLNLYLVKNQQKKRLRFGFLPKLMFCCILYMFGRDLTSQCRLGRQQQNMLEVWVAGGPTFIFSLPNMHTKKKIMYFSQFYTNK